jgi:hypothetical protein
MIFGKLRDSCLKYSEFIEAMRIWRNLKLTNIVIRAPHRPANGRTATTQTILTITEGSPVVDSTTAEAAHASARRLKNAKAPPHSVAASSRELKDVGDDAGGDGSGSS